MEENTILRGCSLIAVSYETEFSGVKKRRCSGCFFRKSAEGDCVLLGGENESCTAKTSFRISQEEKMPVKIDGFQVAMFCGSFYPNCSEVRAQERNRTVHCPS